MSESEPSSRQALLALNGLRHIGPVSLRRLMNAFDGDPLAVLQGSRADWLGISGIGPEIADSLEKWRDFPLEREERNLGERKGIFLIGKDAEYPDLLHEVADPPIGLYRLGQIPAKPCVAIVGTRKPTMYGIAMARKLAGDLAGAGLCVVSGMARGIDTAAHEGALDAGGETIAVFGCGLDIIYPPENLDLFKRICSQGAVLSEFPFGRRADRQTFPMRNRLVSGMSEGVIVVESAAAGGSLITARFAGEQGRQVFAVPGRVDQPSSAGCHQLLRDGAVLARSAMDVIEELAASMRFPAISPPSQEAPDSSLVAELTPVESQIFECFKGGSILGTDEIAALTNLPVSSLASNLTSLELKKIIIRRADGGFEAI
ncbi:MAG: DNA-protecting protein DprA [Opitutae bacterium]|nr:DNA-protecting protein DprA [Opitutae bacterium]